MMDYTQKQELLYKEGVRLLKEHGMASCALFQRKLSIGYQAAHEIVDRMLANGIATQGKNYTIIFNEKGEQNMKNTTFNGMQAKDFFEKVIARESGANDSKAKPSFGKLTYEQYLDLAKQGYKEAFAHLEGILTQRADSATLEEDRKTALAERSFWQTVQFMVAEHYYAKGVLKYEEHLGFMLLCGIGCEVDVERGAALTLQGMQHKAAALEAKIAERVKASLTAEGKATTLVEELILTILDGNGEALSQCVSAAKASDDFVRILRVASSLLSVRIYDAKKEVTDEV